MRTKLLAKMLVGIFCLSSFFAVGSAVAQEGKKEGDKEVKVTSELKKEAKKEEQKQWTDSFNIEELHFSTTGKNKYFILEPSYQLTLEGKDGKDAVKLLVTVLDETKKIGNIETRVVEERETENGELVEISRNYFAMCTDTNSVFYFGEDVDIYKDGKVTGHGGAWRADSENARAGLMMPRIILVGARYYQECAPGVAMDRAEIISNREIFETPAGKFENCLKTEETSGVEKGKEYKYYAPGIGLIKDGNLSLTKYGFVKK